MNYLPAILGAAAIFLVAGFGLKGLEYWFVNHKVVYPRRKARLRAGPKPG